MPTAKPRVAILHYTAPPIGGGVEATLARHARWFAARGYPVKIIAGRGEIFDPRVPVEINPLLDPRHAFVEHVNQKLASGTVTAEFDALTAAIRQLLERALAEVDVCIAHNLATSPNHLAFTCALRDLAETRRRRVIAWCHDFAWDDAGRARRLPSDAPWNALRQAWRAVQYVVVSEARRNELAEAFTLDASAIAVVPPGMDALEFLGASASSARWVCELDLLSAAPLVLLPARVMRRKNIELAIGVTAALRESGLAPKLLVLDPLDAPTPANAIYRDELRALCDQRHLRDQVVFLNERGAVDDATRRDLYLLADVLLLPSARAGFGIPLLQAGLARLPIFCTDLAAFHETAGDAAHYFALDESPEDIADDLADFLAWDSRYRMKRRVVNDYDWERIFTARIEPLVTAG